MKILHIAPIGHHAEGIGTVLQILVKKQQDFGNDVRVISVYENKIYSGINISHIRTSDDLQRYIGKWHPDVAVFHSVYVHQYAKFSKLLLKNNIPYAVQMHGALSEYNYRKKKFLKWCLRKWWLDKFIKEASLIIYLSEAEHRKCIINQINEQSAIIPNGCEIRKFVKEKNNGRPVDIIFVGRIDFVNKGLDVLMSALRLLQSQGSTDFRLTYFGGGDEKSISRLKKELSEVPYLAKYEGPIYGEEKMKRLESSDIFILTSRSEGMPMGVLEALSCGVPCLLTPGTNMAEVVKKAKAGWVCDFSVESIANCIHQACKLYIADANGYRHNAFNLASSYNWDVIAKNSLNVLMNIIKQKQ